MFCPKCGRDCGDISYCPKCKRKFCPNCGSNCKGTNFCPNCGLDLLGTASNVSTSNETPAKMPETEKTTGAESANESAAVETTVFTSGKNSAAQEMLDAAREARKYESQKDYVPAQSLIHMRSVDFPLSKKEKFNQKKAELEASGQVYCPKCLSTSITGNKKGFGIGKAVIGAAAFGGIGLAAGNIGAKKVICTCLKCGYQWKAGKK